MTTASFRRLGGERMAACRQIVFALGATPLIAPFASLTRRRILLTLAACALAISIALLAPLAGYAQPARIYRVGVLSTTTAANAPIVRAFMHGMEELGWIDGKNISIDYRYAEGDADRLPALAADLVRRKVDVIVTLSGTGASAAQRATGTIPIVFVTLTDPVGMGFITSRAQPGGNITGITGIGSELIAKRLQLLQETILKLSRVAIITTGEPTDVTQFAEVQRAAKSLGIDVLSIKVRDGDDLAQALAMLRRWRADSIYVLDASINFYNRELLAKFALANRVPMIAGIIPFAQAGALISYGSNYEDLSRRAATLVDKVLKGAKPADIPVEQAARVELVINLGTAKALGVRIPQSILVRADKVIE
jgi:putative ABC transport system substrate-binding protein